MISDQTKKDFRTMEKSADKENLKLLSCIFTNESGEVVVYSIEQMNTQHLKTVLEHALSVVETVGTKMLIV